MRMRKLSPRQFLDLVRPGTLWKNDTDPRYLRVDQVRTVEPNGTHASVEAHWEDDRGWNIGPVAGLLYRQVWSLCGRGQEELFPTS